MAMIPFDAVLVANRGEIACRIIRTVRELGIRSVAVYTDADRGARHVGLADTAVHIDGYLDADALVAVALRTGATAVHPGYGFLAENADFARACAAAGLAFVGPSPEAIEAMGDKIRAKAHVAARGVPVIPGTHASGMTDADLIAAAESVGLPLIIKPSAGGGGKGMTVVSVMSELAPALESARRVAARAFGDDTLLLERFIQRPRHIEVQVLADARGRVIHLGERECSLQRRHQKIVEEAPSPLLSAETRAAIGEAACEVARSVDYVGAGTVEFLVSDASPGEFFFMEMNTRLQVEHPVTELTTGLDLVEWQLRIAAGEPLTVDFEPRGHAIEARLYAEDPAAGFLPTNGTVLALREPAGDGVRVDSALAVGLAVASDYDPMLAKIVAWGTDREQALVRLDRALAETAVLGVRTNLAFLRSLLADPDVRTGDLDTGLIERHGFEPPVRDARALVTAALLEHAARWSATDTPAPHPRVPGTPDPSPRGAPRTPGSDPDPGPPGAPRTTGALWTRPSGWRAGAPRPARYHLGDAVLEVLGPPEAATVRIDGGAGHPVRFWHDAETATVEFEGASSTHLWARDGDTIWVGNHDLRLHRREERLAAHRATLTRVAGAVSPEVRAAMPGTVVSVSVPQGAMVEAGQPLLALEAMKMEHPVLAPLTGIVSLAVALGDQVRVDQLVATIEGAS